MAAKGGKLSSWGLAFGLVALSVLSVGAQAQTSPHQVTVVSENQIDTIPVSEFEGVSMVPLEALANLIGAELRPGAGQGGVAPANAGAGAGPPAPRGPTSSRRNCSAPTPDSWMVSAITALPTRARDARGGAC